MHMLANLESTPIENKEMERLLRFVPDSGQKAVRKTSVSMVIRDEKRAAQAEADDPHVRETEIIRLPRFMQESRVTGAQIGTAFHRMMRMMNLASIRETGDLAHEIVRQLEAMQEDGVVTGAEYKAVPARMLVELFASPLGVRMLRSEQIEREWAFTYKRHAQDGQIQLVQGIIDCCFMENGKWVLVDYKTDSPTDVSAVMEKHRPQLAVYADALERITKIPVRERILYLVRAGIGVQV